MTDNYDFAIKRINGLYGDSGLCKCDKDIEKVWDELNSSRKKIANETNFIPRITWNYHFDGYPCKGDPFKITIEGDVDNSLMSESRIEILCPKLQLKYIENQRHILAEHQDNWIDALPEYLNTLKRPLIKARQIFINSGFPENPFQMVVYGEAEYLRLPDIPQKLVDLKGVADDTIGKPLDLSHWGEDWDRLIAAGYHTEGKFYNFVLETFQVGSTEYIAAKMFEFFDRIQMQTTQFEKHRNFEVFNDTFALKTLVNMCFAIGNEAANLWWTINHEGSAIKGYRLDDANKMRGKAGGDAVRAQARQRAELLLAEIEKLGQFYPNISKQFIERQAIQNIQKQDPKFPTSEETIFR